MNKAACKGKSYRHVGAAEASAPLLPKLRVRRLKRVLNEENEPAIAQHLGGRS
jgi:hypothetical protein